ncbi:MAG: hypothetical protein QM642_05350 [Edaphocola sp.]
MEATTSVRKRLGKLPLIMLSAAIGGVFIFSAWSKTQPVQYFEYTISSQLKVPQTVAAAAARFFIGLEAALGLLLTLNIFGYRRWVPKAALGLIVIFSLHLSYLLFSVGNDVNCGCMGNLLPMTPGSSLVKNVLLAAGLATILHYYSPTDDKVLSWATLPASAIFIAIPFFLFPVEPQIKMPLGKLYTSAKSEHPVVELRKGKHILCFMSLSCPHCRHAATIIAKLKKENASLPFYFALAAGADSNRDERFKDFMQETKANDIPYHFVATDDFIEMVKASASFGIPVILWMQDTTVVRKTNPADLDAREIEYWIAN